MSLSKYYKSSDSFQPEKVVKQDEKDHQQWQRTRVKETTEDKLIHKTESAGLGKDNLDQLPIGSSDQLGQVAADSKVIDGIAGDDNTTDPVSAAPSEHPGIDMSNYMETIVAESKIEEAYRRGLQEGRENAEQDFGDTQRALLSSCQQLDTIRETLIKNSRTEVLDFAMAIAERIVRISVREQDRTIIATIDEALQQAVKSDEFTIYLHPKDYESVANKTDDLIAGLSGLNNIVIKQDNTLEQGGAKIESDNCTIDSSIATQFEVIREELNKKL